MAIIYRLLFAGILTFAGFGAKADAPVVKAVDATLSSGGWRFDVTISHPETGWDNYADGWQVEAEDGTVLGLRVLVHPHENEQPFTRSLSGVAIPETTDRVFIRTRTNVEGWYEDRFELTLP
ncbi:MAG: hypothetical protein ACC631_02470 [Halocynthiibacter sp.]